jgi:DNA-binding CsgD family transcriptional regulator
MQAIQSGDRENLETALLQLACAETQMGDGSRLDRFLADLSETTNSPWHEGTVECLWATAYIWKGDFENAERLMSQFRIRGYSHYEFDKVADMALHAMCCIAIDDSLRGLSIAREAFARLKLIEAPHPYAKSQREVAAVTCEIAQTLAHRLLGRRSFRIVDIKVETRAATLLKQVLISLGELDEPDNWERAISAPMEELQSFKLGGLSRTIRSCVKACVNVGGWRDREESVLTRAELEVMNLVGIGLSTKEIAAKKDRSVHTIRTLIQRAITKLGCARRSEAVQALRRRGAIPEPLYCGAIKPQ